MGGPVWPRPALPLGDPPGWGGGEGLPDSGQANTCPTPADNFGSVITKVKKTSLLLSLETDNFELHRMSNILA